MSKRHQTNRRRAYGRRQHEIRERVERRKFPQPADRMIEEYGAVARRDDRALFGFGVGERRLGFALGD